jgi:hypothetical protein
MIDYFSRNNRLYYLKRLRQFFFPIISTKFDVLINPEPSIKSEVSELYKALIEKDYFVNSDTVNEIIKNNFHSSSDIEKRLRSNDFFSILVPNENTNNVISFLKNWFANHNNIKFFPLSDCLENSIRLNNLIWFYNIHFEKLDNHDKKFLVMKIIFLSDLVYVFLEKHLNNNHTLIESKNLFVASLFLSNYKFSKKWQQKSSKILYNCLESQISNNGVHIERSSMYQKVIFSEIIELFIITEKYKSLIDSDLYKVIISKIKGLAEYDHIMTFNTDNFFLWGDGYLKDRMIKNINIIDERNNYFKNQNFFDFLKIPPVMKTTDLSFYDLNGFIYLFNKKMTLVFNGGCNLTNKDFAKGHLHSDLLSFCLSVGKTSVIKHAGTFNYNQKSIKYFRGTRGHNTILIDQKEQHDFQNPNASKNVGNGHPKIISDKPNSILVSSFHDGYKKLNVKHTRKINFKNKSFEIADIINGPKKHFFEYFIHLDSGVKCKLMKNKLILENIGEFVFELNDNYQIELLNKSNYNGAWESEGINQKKETNILRIHGSFQKVLHIFATFNLLS